MTKVIQNPVGWTMADEEKYLKEAYTESKIPVLEGYIESMTKRKFWGNLDRNTCTLTAMKYLQKLKEIKSLPA